MNEGTQLDLAMFVANMRADAGLRAWYIRTHKKSMTNSTSGLMKRKRHLSARELGQWFKRSWGV
jgi:hypothetical protein